MRRTLVIDLDRCIGCRSCEVACKMENGVALGAYRCKLITVGPFGSYPDVRMYFLPLMCQQCQDPSCVRVCPTGASYKNPEDGTVLIDKDICIGCESCKRACEYGVHCFNKELRVMDKCMLCQHLQEAGQNPACAKNCPGKAILFGDLDDPSSEVSKALEAAGSDNVYGLNDCKGDPSTRYILRRNEWVKNLPGH